MATCALTSDYTLDECKSGIAGLTKLYFIEKGNVTSMTEVSGVITAITKATGKKFRKYELQRETAFAEDNVESTPANGSIGYRQAITMILNRNSTALRNEILLLGKNLLLAVAEYRDGTFWLYGKTGGLDLNGGKKGSGTAANDRNGYELTFEGVEPELSVEVAADVAAALTTAG